MQRFFHELENFDPDELLLLIGSCAVCLVGFFRWLLKLRPVSKLGCHPLHRAPLYLALLAGFAVIAWVVWRFAAEEVRGNSGYVLLVFAMGGACLTLAAALFPWLGIGLRNDAFEGRNFAAVLALSGAILGVMFTYAAANAGEGPSFWNNVFSSSLATGALLLLWLMVALAGGAASSVVEERDTASGLRLGGLLLAEGLILARAIAGDWHSAAGTTKDFVRDAWPALALVMAAIVVERSLRPTSSNPRPSWTTHGLAPALIYLFGAAAWLARMGWWEGAMR